MEPLHLTLEPGGLVVMKVTGNLTGENIPALEKKMEEGGKIIGNYFSSQGAKVSVLLDATEFGGKYDPAAITAWADFAHHNTNYIEKTAIFGAGEIAKIVIEVVVALSGRKNIQIFSTKNEALGWLGLKA